VQSDAVAGVAHPADVGVGVVVVHPHPDDVEHEPGVAVAEGTAAGWLLGDGAFEVVDVNGGEPMESGILAAASTSTSTASWVRSARYSVFQ
jgi:hypothetical protein